MALISELRTISNSDDSQVGRVACPWVGGDDQPGQGNQAHHPQSSPHGKLPGRQPEPVDFGAHKMREVRLQFPDELLQAAERLRRG
jgi:hypothetical protein